MVPVLEKYDNAIPARLASPRTGNAPFVNAAAQAAVTPPVFYAFNSRLQFLIADALFLREIRENTRRAAKPPMSN
jgi:hypothetical protein